MQSSNLFDNLTQGIASPAHYTIQGKDYDVVYYLVDGIYPKWSMLVQTISQSEDKRKQYFAMMQEACRKMWRGHLMFFSHDFLSSKGRHFFGINELCMIS